MTKVIPDTVSRKQAAQMLVLSPGTLRRYERRGLLTPIKINRKVTRYSITDVETLLKRAGAELPPENPATQPFQKQPKKQPVAELATPTNKEEVRFLVEVSRADVECVSALAYELNIPPSEVTRRCLAMGVAALRAITPKA